MMQGARVVAVVMAKKPAEVPPGAPEGEPESQALAVESRPESASSTKRSGAVTEPSFWQALFGKVKDFLLIGR